MPSSTFRQSLELLRTRRFGTFWFASLLSNIGTWAQLVAEPWLLLSLGASSFLLGLDAFAMSAPVWLLTLVGGVLADRADRRRVIAIFQSIQMLCPMLIVVLLLAGTLQPWMIIVLSVVVGITDALSMPSFFSIVPSIVARDQIGAGLALNATQFNVSRIAGPALAGVLMASVGAAACFALSALSYLPFIGVALWILPRHMATPSMQAARGPRDTLAGIGDIVRAPLLRGALLTTLVCALLCGPLITFCPVLVRDVLHGDVGHFSLAVGAFGVGGVLGAVGLLAVSPGRDRRRLSFWCAAAYGVTLLCAALSPWLWALPAILVAAGASMSVSSTAANTLLQVSAPDHLRGQAVSLYMLAMRGGIAVGSLVTGLSVTVLGARMAILLNGALTLVALAAIGPAWLRAEDHPPLPVMK